MVYEITGKREQVLELLAFVNPAPLSMDQETKELRLLSFYRAWMTLTMLVLGAPDAPMMSLRITERDIHKSASVATVTIHGTGGVSRELFLSAASEVNSQLSALLNHQKRKKGDYSSFFWLVFENGQVKITDLGNGSFEVGIQFLGAHYEGYEMGSIGFRAGADSWINFARAQTLKMLKIERESRWNCVKSEMSRFEVAQATEATMAQLIAGV